MNQFSQQPGNFQGQQGFQNQGSQFQPIGNVQSHYQGQLSQPTFGRQTNSIVSNEPSGYQAFNSYNQGTQQYAPTGYSNMTNPAGTNNSFISHQPVQSYAQSPAMAFGSFGPVISHVGFQAGQDSQQGRQQSFNQTSAANYGLQNAQFAASNFGGFNQSNAQSGYGMTPTQSYTASQNPVLQATNTYQQAGPVISHLGGFTASNAQNQSYYGGNR
ncbi:hypothetical protein [Paenibacillus sp. Soil522]|uniref:hypothetical protein n=1 Tax=Paenibacillus sp. Soil522 TaxID=1736388 RepID=UPI0006F4AF7E|nr:hypothetical protein [Paenibacillus sp. Soil522]KRE40508.1 hypothetical protein ASG81_17105 [Paenibacillus sp. Soil522]